MRTGLQATLARVCQRFIAYQRRMTKTPSRNGVLSGYKTHRALRALDVIAPNIVFFH